MGCVKLKYSFDRIKDKTPDGLDRVLNGHHLSDDDFPVYRDFMRKAPQMKRDGLIPPYIKHFDIRRDGVYNVTGCRNETPIKIF